MKLNVSPIADTKEFTDRWNLGVTYTVRRTGHPKAADKQVSVFEEENEVARGRATAAASERARKNGLPSGVLSLVLNDLEYSDKVTEIEKNEKKSLPAMQERKAAALLAGWKGEAFEKNELPKKGAFDADFARKVFFESLDDDDLRIPRFRHIDGEFVSHDTEEYDKLCLFVQEKDTAMLKEKSRAKSNEEEGKKKDDVALFKQMAKIQESHGKLYRDELKELGFEEVPCYGQTLRSAWATHIIDNAAEVELAYNRARGQLQRAS